MSVLNFAAWKTADPTIVAAVAGHVADFNSWHEAIEQFMVDVNIAYPVEGGIRVPLMDGDVLVAVGNPFDPMGLMDGWTPSLMLGGHIPDSGSQNGAQWAARMDSLPAHPGPLEDAHVRIALHGDIGPNHVHADFWLDTAADEPAVYVVWPVGEEVAPLVEAIIADFGGNDMWKRISRIEAVTAYESTLTR